MVLLRIRLFWAQMALASLVPFQGPKKSRFLGPTPFQCPSQWCCTPQNHDVLRHKNNRYINSYYVHLHISKVSSGLYEVLEDLFAKLHWKGKTGAVGYWQKGLMTLPSYRLPTEIPVCNIHVVQSNQWEIELKGQCHEIFEFWFFQKSVSPKPLSIPFGPFQIFRKNSQKYSQLKVHHRWLLKPVKNGKNLQS